MFYSNKNIDFKTLTSYFALFNLLASHKSCVIVTKAFIEAKMSTKNA